MTDIERVDALIEQGKALLENRASSDPRVQIDINVTGFTAWRVQCIDLIEGCVGPKSAHAREFDKNVSRAAHHDVEIGIGTLQALRAKIEEEDDDDFSGIHVITPRDHF